MKCDSCKEEVPLVVLVGDTKAQYCIECYNVLINFINQISPQKVIDDSILIEMFEI
jgi:hypothetical protein